MSGQALRVLILEDEPADAELELAALAEGGFRCEPTLVDGRAAFESAFGPGRFELVIADYRLPDYTGLEALEHVRRRDALVPFVLVSGALGEERAVEALRSGATDYVLKHGLARLASAVRRALEERREHERHLATRRALELSQERLRALSRRLLEVQEEERGRLARDLHDDIGQALTALKIQLESLARAAGPVGNRILECVETTRHTLERVRQLSLSLRPLQLDDLGLVAALRSRCATTAAVSIWMGRNAAAPRARAWAWSAWRSASRLPAARSSCARPPDRGRYCWQHSRCSLAKGKGTVDSRRACR
jgi:CheY-like chemotaxis protein